MTGGVECSVAGVAEQSVAGGAECFVAGAVVCFWGAFLVAHSVCCHPSLLHALPHFCKWGNVVPMKNLLQPT